jgi:GTPase SAR1 family protein
MGCLGSKEAPKADSANKEKSTDTGKDSTNASKTRKNKGGKLLKLLLLGGPQTGKSTFLKQLQFNFVQGFNDEQRLEIIRSLRDNLVVGFRDIIEYAEKETKEFDEESKSAISYFKDVSLAEDTFTPDLVKNAKAFWGDKKMQEMWENKDAIPTLLVMNLDYIMDNIDRVGAAGAKANDEDILRSRQRTMQSNQISFSYKNYDIEVTDVGGQKTSRRRWSQVVENPTAIIYFAALSDYNVRSFDGEGTKFQEAVDIWKTVVETAAFSKAVLVLMLNKYDLFVEKLKKVPFSKAYKRYTGSDEPDEVAKYLKERFLRVVPEDRQANFMYNLTCALDTSQMKTVFNSIQDNIVNRAISDAFV